MRNCSVDLRCRDDTRKEVDVEKELMCIYNRHTKISRWERERERENFVARKNIDSNQPTQNKILFRLRESRNDNARGQTVLI